MEMTGAVITGIVCGVAFVAYVIYAIIKGQRRKLTAGAEEMIGKIAVAQTTLNPKGTVLAEGELWTAIAQGSKIEPDEEVIITKIESLKLWVTRKPEGKEEK
jgi:membrane-bound serine protease (ClpP class)